MYAVRFRNEGTKHNNKCV